MFVAHRDHGAYRVPGAVLEWVEVPGHGEVGISSAPAYLNTDGSIEAGYSSSPVRTNIVYTHFPEDGATYEENRRVRPVVCKVCHDSGEDGSGWSNWCGGCHGHGHRKNLHLCSGCGEYAAEVLPVAPREVANHPLLLARTHPACAIESLRAELVGRASEAA